MTPQRIYRWKTIFNALSLDHQDSMNETQLAKKLELVASAYGRGANVLTCHGKKNRSKTKQLLIVLALE